MASRRRPFLTRGAIAGCLASCNSDRLADGRHTTDASWVLSVLLVVAVVFHGLFVPFSLLPEIQARDNIVTNFVFECIENLMFVSSVVISISILWRTSRVDVCNHLIFFAVTI
jgi:hypothetical protein